ncbi:MAG: hypothetical protein SFW09_11160 [Hyphomicrobiaceae bacterium]|nr:hypothetical protein [Hyphomicrobiaceae bacterium]
MMTDEPAALGEMWRLRNAAAETLVLTEEQMCRAVRGASVDDLVALIDTYSPARSTGPEWTRTFELLVERLWVWRDDETMAALAKVYAARGMPWLAIKNAFAPEHGARLRAALRHPAGARLPAFTVA